MSASSESAAMPGHIGVIGCSAEGAALCYRTICMEGAQFFGAHGHPEITIHTFSLASYTKCLERNDWKGVGDLILASARKLAAAGADFLICPDNTIHSAYPLIANALPLPFLHIANVVVGDASARGFRRVGLMGTRWLVDGDVYPAALDKVGIMWVRPQPADRDELSRIIMEELVPGRIVDRSVKWCCDLIRRMQRDDQCDAVILGCTELPLIINEGNSPIPVLDSTRLLARAALSQARRSSDDKR